MAIDLPADGEKNWGPKLRKALTQGLDARYLQPVRPRVGFIGDSITAGYGNFAAGNVGNIEYADNPATHAMLASDGRWDLIVSAGIGGQRSDQIRARLPQDIIGLGVQVCVISSCMWNDIGQGLTVDQTMANFEGMLDDLQAVGILPIVALMTPDGRNVVTTERVAAMQQRNLRILNLATTRGIRVVDVQTPLIDPENGAIRAEYDAPDSNAGTVHPSPAGYRAMGLAFQKVLDEVVPARAHGLVAFATDPTDLLGGKGLHLVQGATSGLGDLWFSSAPGAGVTFSRPDATSGIGKAQRIAVAGTTTDTNKGLQTALTAGWSVGDVLEISGIMTTSGVQGRVQIQSGGSPTPYVNHRIRSAVSQTGGKLRVRYKVPAGSTNVGVTLTVSPGTGYLEVERLALRNLTALGLA